LLVKSAILSTAAPTRSTAMISMLAIFCLVALTAEMLAMEIVD
jgi:hypothetical protein